MSVVVVAPASANQRIDSAAASSESDSPDPASGGDKDQKKKRDDEGGHTAALKKPSSIPHTHRGVVGPAGKPESCEESRSIVPRGDWWEVQEVIRIALRCNRCV